jgi:hypothetical protein
MRDGLQLALYRYGVAQRVDAELRFTLFNSTPDAFNNRFRVTDFSYVVVASEAQCSSVAPGTGSRPSHVSGGSVLLIIFFTTAAIYFGGGTLWNYTRGGQIAVPHATFWQV